MEPIAQCLPSVAGRQFVMTKQIVLSVNGMSSDGMLKANMHEDESDGEMQRAIGTEARCINNPHTKTLRSKHDD